MPNRATMEDGKVFECTTDAEGMTEVSRSEIPFAHYDFEAGRTWCDRSEASIKARGARATIFREHATNRRPWR